MLSIRVILFGISIFFLNTSLFASEILFETASILLERVEKPGIEIIKINSKEGQTINQWSRNSVLFSLKSFQVLEAKTQILALKWPKGAHGEEIVFFDINKKKEIWHNRSSWPYKITLEDKVIKVRYVDGHDHSGKPIEKQKKF